MSDVPLIVHVVYAFKAGGLENGLVNIINRTPPERYRHAIVCLTEADEFRFRLERDDVEIIELHKKSGHDWGLFWRVFMTLRRLRPAIVHTRNLATIEMQLVASVFPRIKQVHGEHGRDIGDVEGKNKKFILIRKLMAPFINRYIAVSKDLCSWLENTIGINSAKLTQIYNGVDHSRFGKMMGEQKELLPRYFMPEGGIIVGTVGRLAEVKNQALLIRSIERIFQLKPHLKQSIRLVLVGGGPTEVELKSVVAGLQLDDFVWFAGSRDDIPELMQAMDVFVLPSLGEGISNTILEAMATGLPVIATDVGGNPELVTHEITGKLVAVSDVDSMSSAIIELVEDSEKRANMGEKALSQVKRSFDWNVTVESYFSVYDELLSRRRGSLSPWL